MNIRQKLASVPKGKVIKIVVLLVVGGFALLLSRGIKKKNTNKSIEDELLGQIAQKKSRKDSLAKAGGEASQKQANLLKEYQGKREEKSHAQKLKQDRDKRLAAAKNKMEIRFSGEGELPTREPEPKKQPSPMVTKSTGVNHYPSSSRLSTHHRSTLTEPAATATTKTVQNRTLSTPAFGSSNTEFKAITTKTSHQGNGAGFEAVIDGTQTLTNGQRVRLLIKSGKYQGAAVKPNTLAYAQLNYKQNRAVMVLYQVQTVEGTKRGAVESIGQDGQSGLFLTGNRSNRVARKAMNNRLTNKLGDLANNATGGIAGEVAGITGAVFRDKSRQEKIRLFNGTRIFFR